LAWVPINTHQIVEREGFEHFSGLKEFTYFPRGYEEKVKKRMWRGIVAGNGEWNGPVTGEEGVEPVHRWV
jgi:hypothetical protein